MQVTSSRAIDGPNGWRGPGDYARIAVSPTAWSPDDDLSLREWAEQGRRLGVIGRGVGWWIGDWLRYGNARFGERYVRAARITGYDVQTLMNMAYVASRFDSDRRRPNLSFSHHAELAAREEPEQEYWLDRAESERLSVRCLREELRRERSLLRAEAEAEEQALETTAGAGAEDEVVCPECGAHIHVDKRPASVAA
ncbi:MAG TPA: LmbU family transcriptional regulator [Thermoleophilaceae bacterium]|jgi:hypothetical protein